MGCSLKAEVKVTWLKEKGCIEYRFSKLSYYFIRFLQAWVDLLGSVYNFDRVETYQEADTFTARFYASESIIHDVLEGTFATQYPVETE